MCLMLLRRARQWTHAEVWSLESRLLQCS